MVGVLDLGGVKSSSHPSVRSWLNRWAQCMVMHLDVLEVALRSLGTVQIRASSLHAAGATPCCFSRRDSAQTPQAETAIIHRCPGPVRQRATLAWPEPLASRPADLRR